MISQCAQIILGLDSNIYVDNMPWVNVTIEGYDTVDAVAFATGHDIQNPHPSFNKVTPFFQPWSGNRAITFWRKDCVRLRRGG